MDNLSVFLLIGCDDNGIHTEAVTLTVDISDACIAFAERDMGPIKFMEVAEGLRDAGEINNGDLNILTVAKDTGKIDVDEIDRYGELVDKVGSRMVDIASLVFNFGQFAEGTEWDGKKHNNYVDGDSASQWKIYQIKPEAKAADTVSVLPKDANETCLIRKRRKE